MSLSRNHQLHGTLRILENRDQPGTVVQVHQWAAQPRLLSADGTPLGTVQAALNPLRTGVLRAQVAQDVSKIDITYLGPDDLSGA